MDVRPAADIFAWFGIIRITSDGVDIDKKTFDRMRIAGRDVTPLYLVEFVLGIEDELVKTAQDIDAVHYLQITVDVSGYHSPLKAKLIPYWEQAKEEGCTKQITVTGAKTIDQDFSRID